MSGKNERPDEEVTKQSNKDDSGKINALQITAATGAASTAAVVANALGISGTVVGVAVFSVVSSVATVLYLKYMHRTKETLNKVRNRTGAQTVVRGPVPEPGPASRTETTTSVAATGATARGTAAVPKPDTTVAAEPPMSATARTGQFLKRNWRPIAVSSLVVFVASVGLLTALALVSGKPATTYYDAHPQESNSTQRPSPSDDSNESGSGDSESTGDETPSDDETPSTESDEPTSAETPSDEPEPSTQDSGDADSKDRDRDLKGTPSGGEGDASDR